MARQNPKNLSIVQMFTDSANFVGSSHQNREHSPTLCTHFWRHSYGYSVQMLTGTNELVPLPMHVWNTVRDASTRNVPSLVCTSHKAMSPTSAPWMLPLVPSQETLPLPNNISTAHDFCSLLSYLRSVSFITHYDTITHNCAPSQRFIFTALGLFLFISFSFVL